MSEAFWSAVSSAGVPAGDGWLSPRERRALQGLRFPRRRSDWRAGRWAAKRALEASRAIPDIADGEVAILAAADGAPEVWAGAAPSGVAVSISHRDGMAMALVCRGAAAAGCDIELVEPRTGTFARDWLTAGELAVVDRAGPGLRDLLVTLMWSAKESALKAVRRGLRADTRTVEIAPAVPGGATGEAGGWAPFSARFDGVQMDGWWRHDGRHVMTTVTQPATDPPVLIEKEKL